MIDPREKAERIAILTRMLLGHPGEIEEDRLRWYLEVTEIVPLELLGRACVRASRLQLETPWAPGAGQIVASALALDPQVEHSANVGTLKPAWYRRGLRRLRAAELPQESGARIGAPVRAIGPSGPGNPAPEGPPPLRPRDGFGETTEDQSRSE